MKNDWVKIYSSFDFYKVEIVQAILQDNEIESIILNKKDSAYLFGEIELYVDVENALKSKQLISSVEL